MNEEEIKRGFEVVKKILASVEPKRCKYCGSYHVRRYGHYKGVQRLFCNDCKHKFVDNEAQPGMKTSAEVIGSAVSMFYEGLSLNAIRRQLQQEHGIYPSDSTVYEWIRRYTDVVIDKAKSQKPNVGDVWVADETVLKIEGRNTWFWDIIDIKTRYLLASHISTSRNARDAKKLMELASARAGKAPKIVVTDKLLAYLDGIELAFGAETKHIQSKKLTTNAGQQLIERFHGTLKQRTKVMRGLKRRDTAKAIMDGWLVHYNDFKPHEGIEGQTPALKAGITFPYNNWLDVVKTEKAKPKITVTTLPAQTVTISELSKVKSPKHILGHFAGHRKRQGKPREIDLGAGVVIDRRGQHLRLY